jgi:hypothetical protein
LDTEKRSWQNYKPITNPKIMTTSRVYLKAESGLTFLKDHDADTKHLKTGNLFALSEN